MEEFLRTLKFVGLSGILWILSVLLGGLAAGPTFITYQFWFVSSLFSLAALVSVRAGQTLQPILTEYAPWLTKHL